MAQSTSCANDFPDVQIIINERNYGFAAANNIGIQAAQGDYLVLLNPDVYVEPDTFQVMLDYLKTAPDVGIVGPRTFTIAGKVDLSAHAKLTVPTVMWQFWGLDRLFPYAMIGHYLRQSETATEPFQVDWLSGHCLMFRRAVYEQIGGLDEGLFLYNEEPDFCDRAEAVDWRCVYVPQAKVLHLGSTSISRYSYAKMLHTHISMLYYFRKRKQYHAVIALKIGFVMEISLKWAIRAVQLVTKPTEVIRNKVRAYGKVMLEVVCY